MQTDDNRFEDQLRSLQPVAPSRELARRVERALDDSNERSFWTGAPALWLGGTLALAASVALLVRLAPNEEAGPSLEVDSLQQSVAAPGAFPWADADIGSIELKRDGDRRILLIRDLEGTLVFEEPLDSKEQLLVFPESLRNRVEALLENR